ncbi:hypothetical protein F4703DRAFT_1831955 [Phycomyces blakesleeanus]
MQVPEPIPLDDHVFDFAFHPKESLLVAGLITGHVHCYRYGVEGNQQLWSTQLSKKSCRGVEFTPEGSGNLHVLGLYQISMINFLYLYMKCL